MRATCSKAAATSHRERDYRGVLRASHHAYLPHPTIDLGRPVGNEAMLAVKSLRTRVGVGDPQRRRLFRMDDRIQKRRANSRAMLGRVYIEHIQVSRPRRLIVQVRARHGDSDQLAVPFGYGHAVLAKDLVGQRGIPEPLPRSQEAWVFEYRVRHESPICLLPGPPMHARHLRYVLDLSQTNSARETHLAIVCRGKDPAGCALVVHDRPTKCSGSNGDRLHVLDQLTTRGRPGGHRTGCRSCRADRWPVR